MKQLLTFILIPFLFISCDELSSDNREKNSDHEVVNSVQKKECEVTFKRIVPSNPPTFEEVIKHGEYQKFEVNNQVFIDKELINNSTKRTYFLILYEENDMLYGVVSDDNSDVAFNDKEINEWANDNGSTFFFKKNISEKTISSNCSTYGNRNESFNPSSAKNLGNLAFVEFEVNFCYNSQQFRVKYNSQRF